MAKKKKKVNKVAASAMAAVTAAGVLVGGAYSSPDELLNDGAQPIVMTLVSDGAQIDDGGPAPDGVAEEEAASEEDEKRGVFGGVRRLMRASPAGVRALVGLPLWGLGTAVIALLSTLWSAVLSPAAAAALSWLGIALTAALIFALAVKTAFPDLPLKKILNRRSLVGIGVLCLLFGIADAALPFFWDDYRKLSGIVKAVGSLVCTAVPVAFFVRRHQRRHEPETVEAEVVEIAPEPELTPEEKEAAARRLVAELADSVCPRTY